MRCVRGPQPPAEPSCEFRCEGPVAFSACQPPHLRRYREGRRSELRGSPAGHRAYGVHERDALPLAVEPAHVQQRQVGVRPPPVPNIQAPMASDSISCAETGRSGAIQEATGVNLHAAGETRRARS